MHSFDFSIQKEAAVCAAGEAKQWAEATQDAMEKAALAQLRGVQTGLVSDLSIEASRPVQQMVVTKIVEGGRGQK